MTSPFNALNTAIYGTLSGGTALTALLSGTTAIYNTQASDEAVLPYVVFSHAGGGQEALTPSNMQNIVYFIRAYTDTSAALAGSIDAQIDTLLHKMTLSVTGWTNIYTAREDQFSNTETPPDGNTIFMAGAYYRFRLDE
jgi:hypothetical protein